ncbi:unnamed protein product, partial [marine sediment metagenome]
MSYPNKYKRYVYKLLDQGYSPNQIADKMSLEKRWEKDGIPSIKAIYLWRKARKKELSVNQGLLSNVQKESGQQEVISLEVGKKDRDGDIFHKSSQIINDAMFHKIIKFLQNTCVSKSQMRRIEYFISFFDLEANKYIDMSLRHSCYKLCIKLNELLDFWEEYSVEYCWYEP